MIFFDDCEREAKNHASIVARKNTEDPGTVKGLKQAT